MKKSKKDEKEMKKNERKGKEYECLW